MTNILIIEDEQDIQDLLNEYFSKNGFNVSGALNGEEGLSLASNQIPDFIILDWMLPKMDGIEVCKQLGNRAKTKHIPILMLSAKGEEIDKVLALEIGADDYMVKPFSPRELLARVKAILRRSNPSDNEEESSKRRLGTFTIDDDQYDAFLEKKPLTLTKTEFEILQFMSKFPLKAFSREDLLNDIWGDSYYSDERLIDVHIRRLRSKIEKHTSHQYIATVHGIGYKFNPVTA